MASETISAIILSVILLTAAGILFWGIRNKGIRRISVGAALLLFGLFILLDRFPKYANTFNAWAMLLLAIGAFIAVAVSIWLEDRRRRENDQLRSEERHSNFKRRCLDDIQDWAQRGIVLFTELRPWHIPEEQKQNLIRLAPLRAINNWVMNASREFDERQLPKKVDEAAENLKEYVEMMEGLRGDTSVADMHERCRESFINVLEHIAALKVKLQL